MRIFVFDLIREAICEVNHIPTLSYSDTFFLPLLYDSYEFHEYHARFVDEQFCLYVVKDNQLVGKAIGALKENVVKLPYSAPFSMVYFDKGLHPQELKTACKAFGAIGELVGCTEVSITLPPPIYDEFSINLLLSAFLSIGYQVYWVDINNYMDLESFADLDDLLRQLSYNFRKKTYKVARKANLRFLEIDKGSYEVCYDIVQSNKEKLGREMRLSKKHFHDLIDTYKDRMQLFTTCYEGKAIAACAVTRVNEYIVQPIISGDLLEYRKYEAVSFQYIQLALFYKANGVRYIDYGPSSIDGKMSEDLLFFKNRLGCRNSVKYTIGLH